MPAETRDLIASLAAKIPETNDDTPLTESIDDGNDSELGVGADEPSVEGDAATEPVGGDGVLEGAESTEAVPAVDVVAEPAAEPVVDPAVAAAPAQTEKQKQLEAFAAEHKLGKDKLGRFNRIPHDVVATRIVPNAIKKARAEWDTKELQPLKAVNTEYEGRLKAIAEHERIMFSEPRRMLSILGQIPGYSQLYSEMGLKGSIEDPKAAVGTKVAQPGDDDPMPTADVKDAQGKAIGWSDEGLNKRFEWSIREGARQAEARIEAKLAPMTKRFQNDTAKEQDERHIDAALNTAQGWPGFSENTTAILDVFSKDTSDVSTPSKMMAALDKAYKTVLFGVLTQTRQTEEEKRQAYWEQFQAEVRKAPRAATATTSTVARHEPALEAGDGAVSSSKQLILDSLKAKRMI